MAPGLPTVMESLASAPDCAPAPAMIAFHVGITRIEGNGFGGAAPVRTRALLVDPAVRATVAATRPAGSGHVRRPLRRPAGRGDDVAGMAARPSGRSLGAMLRSDTAVIPVVF